MSCSTPVFLKNEFQNVTDFQIYVSLFVYLQFFFFITILCAKKSFFIVFENIWRAAQTYWLINKEEEVIYVRFVSFAVHM